MDSVIGSISSTGLIVILVALAILSFVLAGLRISVIRAGRRLNRP